MVLSTEKRTDLAERADLTERRDECCCWETEATDERRGCSIALIMFDDPELEGKSTMRLSCEGEEDWLGLDSFIAMCSKLKMKKSRVNISHLFARRVFIAADYGDGDGPMLLILLLGQPNWMGGYVASMKWNIAAMRQQRVWVN